MVFQQSFALFALAAVGLAAAGVVPVAPAGPVLAKLEDFDAAPQYSFAYDVQDALTGDSKAQYESRNGDVVQGSYSLIEADGTRRIVDYTADPVNGFNAVVSREPAVAVAPVVAKTAVLPAVPAAPVVAKAVVAPAAPVVAKTVVAPAAVAAPIVARSFYQPAAVAAPLAYTVPRAYATRVSAPAAYAAAYATPFAAPYSAYAVAQNFL